MPGIKTTKICVEFATAIVIKLFPKQRKRKAGGRQGGENKIK